MRNDRPQHKKVLMNPDNTFATLNALEYKRDTSNKTLLILDWNRPGGERIEFSGPNTNTNIIRVHKFDRIRIRILFGAPLLIEFEYEYLDYSNNTEYEYEYE